VRHFSERVRVEFRAVLFLPRLAPFDPEAEYEALVYMPREASSASGLGSLQLAGSVLPEWLNMIVGIVDSRDLCEADRLPRGNLQRDTVYAVLRERLVEKCVDMFEEIAEREDDFREFFIQFGGNMEKGILQCHPDDRRWRRLDALLRRGERALQALPHR